MSETTNTPAPAKAINTNPFTRCFSGLDLLFKHNQTMAIIILAVSIISGGLRLIGNFFPSGSQDTVPHPAAAVPDPINIGLLLALLIPIILVAIIISIVVSTYISGVTNYVAWKTSRHETTTLGESLRVVTKRFWTLLVVQVIVGLKILGGFLLLIVPGVRAAMRYQMVLFPVFEEGLNATNAIKRIKGLTRQHLMEIFGISTVGTLIPIVGGLLMMGGQAVMYPELKALEASDAPRPKVHWLNYIGFILLGGIVLLVAFFALIVLLITAVAS